jgi:type VI secretion system protein VasD
MAIVHYMIVLSLLSALSGCGLLNAIPPDPTILKLTLIADRAVNPMPNQVSAPIQVHLFIMRTQSLFLQTDPETIVQKASAIFGADLIDKRLNVLDPGAKDTFEIKLPPEAYFVGVVAAFRKIEFAKAQKLIRIQPQQVNKVQLLLKGNEVIVEYVDEKLIELPAPLPSL